MSRIRVRAGLTASVVLSLLVMGLTGLVGVPQAGAATGPVVSLGDASGLERDTVRGSVFVPVFLSEPAAAPVTVAYHTVAGTASSGVDYLVQGTPSVPRTLTVPAGSRQATINLTVLADGAEEGDESLSVVVTSVSGGSAILGDETGLATIVDADGASAALPAITVSSGKVVEGDAGTRKAQFLVHLSRAAATNVKVGYSTLNGTAVAPADYKAVPAGSVTFPPGTISKTIDVLVNANSAADGDRSFSLAVTVTEGSVAELTMTGTSTIVDDELSAPDPVTPIAAGGGASCGVMGDGTVRCWGVNAVGQLGNGTNTSSNVPVTVSGITDAVDVSAATPVNTGIGHACAARSDGTVSCWGDNTYGQLGNGTTTSSNVPVAVTGITTAVGISAGQNHTCALLADGTARCWGFNGAGRLGDGTTTSSNVPVTVIGVRDAVVVESGAEHACSLSAYGTVSCWGNNGYGELGRGTFGGGSATPAVVAGITDAVALDAGSTTCVVVGDGTVRCWGANFQGQLGNGTTTGSASPVTVTGVSGATEISASVYHTCAVLTDGTARCWGGNNRGQLGDGTTTDRLTPVAASGVSDIDAISVGTYHTCALLADGTARCWGFNASSQLGNGTTTNSNVPVVVAGFGAPLCAPGASSTSGAEPCTPAPAGSFVATTGATSPTPCPLGTFQALTGQSACTNAPLGFYAGSTGQAAATPAPPGSFVDVEAAIAWTQCAIGTFQPAIASQSCLDAPIGSYVDTSGSATPTACPVGLNTLALGSTSASDCVAGVIGSATITDVTFSGPASDPTVTVTGTGFGTLASLGTPVAVGDGSFGYQFGDGGPSIIFGKTGSWAGGQCHGSARGFGPSCGAVGLEISSYSSTEIVFTFGSYYDDFGQLDPGDPFDVWLFPPTTTPQFSGAYA